METNNQTNNKEMVNHPDHYKDQKYECIDVMADVFGIQSTKDFCKLNAFKYIWRSNKKGKDLEDMKKAKWYIDKYIDLESNTESPSAPVLVPKPNLDQGGVEFYKDEEDYYNHRIFSDEWLAQVHKDCQLCREEKDNNSEK